MLQSMGPQRVRHDLATGKQQQQNGRWTRGARAGGWGWGIVGEGSKNKNIKKGHQGMETWSAQSGHHLEVNI